MAPQAAKGWARAGDRALEPKPAILRLLLEQILRGNPVSDACVRAVCANRAFLLRVQSECLPLARLMPLGRQSLERARNLKWARNRS